MNDTFEKVDNETVRITRRTTTDVSFKDIAGKANRAQINLDEFEARTLVERSRLQAALNEATNLLSLATNAPPINK